MPTYEYKCEKCHIEYDEEHSITEKREECKECGGKLKRVISGGLGFHLVGGSWGREGYK